MLPKILLVDDRPENLVVLEATLRAADRELLLAHSAAAALELLLVHEVAVALVDVQMPEIDGFQLAELMRGAERTRGIPIIFVTAGHDEPTRIFAGYEAGAVDFLAKPLDTHVLRSKVEVFLELFRQRRQLLERIEALDLAQRQLREADRQKDEFLAALSHELRNPLMPIRNSLYVLERAPAGSEQSRRALGVMQRQVGHLAHLVDDLLDVTRISRGKIQLQRTGVDLVSLVQGAAEDHRAAFADAGIAFETTLPAEPLTVDADPVRLAQVVGNLLGNAAKFTLREGHVRLELEAVAGEVELRVRDDGVGMAPETLERLFRPFTQADRTLARSRGGLGLGLAVVKSLVEMHGGSVRAHSDGIGCGALFVVRLPLGAARPAALAAGSGAVAAPVAARRVLVVEDNADGAAVLRDALELMGHEVAIASDGSSALATARRFRPHVVFCDIGLPGMNGYEVARAFRGDAGLREARLVAVTGYALPQDRERALAAGFSEHMSKPPRIDVLERLLAAQAGREAG